MIEKSKRVIVRRKAIKKRDKTELTLLELKSIKQWILTGSFSRNIYLDLNYIDLSKIYLLKKAVFTNVDELSKLMLNNSQIAIKKEPLILTLIFLSMGNFHAKKIFKSSFNKIIKSPNDLYHFLSLVKKYRGMGSIIHLVIKRWINSRDVHELERIFIEEPSKYGWSGQDIVKLIKPKPRNKIENYIFKWLSKGKIDFNDKNDYKNLLPLIYLYEQFKNNSYEEPISNLLDKFNFKASIIPGNVHRSHETIIKILKEKTDEELFKYVSNKLFNNDIVEYFGNRLKTILKDNININVDIITELALANYMVNFPIDANIIMNLETLIEKQVKEKRETIDNVVHIIDMSNDMFKRDFPYTQVSPAIIASVITSRYKEVWTFNGIRKRNNSIRGIIEAEGKYEFISHIKPKKFKNAKAIFVWTNREYLGNIEKSLSILKENNLEAKVCLVNLGKGKISSNSNRYFTINSYNSGYCNNTKKVIKLIERGLM